jgi:hypothetical protein
MEKFLKIAAAVLLLTLWVVSDGTCAGALELLTREEAALPESKNFGFAAPLRDAGPAISVQDMEIGADRRSFPLVVGFAPKDGRPVDIVTLRLECLKSAPLDLTARIRPYAGKDGIKMDIVSLPPGFYRFRVAIGDCNGRLSEKEFTVKVSVTY